MTLITQPVRVTALAGKRGRHLTCLVLAIGLWALPAAGHAASKLTPTVDMGFGPDDFNVSQLNPVPPTPIFASATLDTALGGANFDPAHNWNFSYAGANNSGFVQRDLTINDYFAWVVNEPNVTAPDGTVYPGRFHNEDAGGAVFVVTYMPQGTDPANIHFLQAYNQSLNGGPFMVHLDNAGQATPWYDPGGASGINTLPPTPPNTKNGSWFLDTSADQELEREDWHTDVQFSLLIAVDSVNNGVHNVTIYGGDAWGYKYTTLDIVTPELDPGSSAGALALLVGGVLTLAGRRRRGSAATTPARPGP